MTKPTPLELIAPDDFDPRDCEPDCTCQRIDVDLYDDWCCDLCNRDSQWNRDCRTAERNDRPKIEIKSLPPITHEPLEFNDDCPF